MLDEKDACLDLLPRTLNKHVIAEILPHNMPYDSGMDKVEVMIMIILV